MQQIIFCTVFILILAHSAWSCPSGTKAKEGEVWKDRSVCTLTGPIQNDIVLEKDYSYYLNGSVFVGDDNKSNVTLTIESGVFIGGKTGSDLLVVTRGSKIEANGTATNPIVFTTYVDNPKRGSWGGLIINGNAPINDCVRVNRQGFCEADGEGSTGWYGGGDPMDSSGVLKYVRVEWAGHPIDGENELNGIAFQGVGAKTVVDFIQVHQGIDDGIEFFGGTVNVKHVYLTYNQDDSMDWTSGWTGRAQFVFIKQADDEGNNGIEADNLKSPMNAEPRSNPIISHATLVGSSTAKKGGVGVLLRRGTNLKLYNSVITGFKRGGIDIDDEETFVSGRTYSNDLPGIHIANTVFDNKKNFVLDTGEVDIRRWILEGMDMDVLFGLEPVRESRLGSSLIPKTPFESVLPPDDEIEKFFKDVAFIGAFDPTKQDNWATGWTID